MEQEERSLLQQRVFAASKSTQETILTGGVGVGVVFLIFALVFSQVRRENLGRREVEAQLQQANVVLTQNLLTVEQWGNEMKLLSAMSEMLQSCRSQEEAFVIIHRTIRQLLPDETGALCIINSSRTLADSMLSWGEDQAELSQLLFDPEQCWGLRRGQSYLVEDTTIGVTCGHISAESAKSPSTTLCLPLLAHGEMMGLLYVRAPRPASLSLDKQHAARAAADQIALSLSNLRLQDKLRHQAIRDPLTGLYNRRYMEASLERELARAIRHQHPLSIIMTDVDHFKRYNDTFGHEAGDLLLQEFGALLKKRCRADDIACRYGGEEFMLIMPEASCEVARQRAEQLRETVKQLRVEYRNQMLGAVTISLGLATFPLHGSNGDDVLRAADRALYQAKQSGRDRVVVVGELNPSPLNGTVSKEHRDEAELPPAEAA
jgi:diguanylate cyclase (GGDEF)-like protein